MADGESFTSWCAPKCPIRPTERRSITGTRPITCLGQSGFSAPDAAGGAGDAPTRLSIMPFTNLPISLRRKWRPGPRNLAPLIADFDRVWGNRVPRRARDFGNRARDGTVDALADRS